MAWQAALFVAAVGASSYTWAEATRDQQMESWLQAHMHAFEFWGGVQALAVPDNTRTGVRRQLRSESVVACPSQHRLSRCLDDNLYSVP